MAITDAQKVDLLFKKIAYGVTQTNQAPNKQGYEETVASPIPIYNNQIWSEATSIPNNAPLTTSGVVTYYGTTSAIRMTSDPTVGTNKTWFATTTYNNASTRVGDWIPPSIDPSYLVTIYNGNPSSGGTPINQGVNNQEWVFDYSSGVLNFPNNLPGGLTQVWIVGHRYTGTKGLGTPSSVTAGYDSLVYSGSTEYTSVTLTNFFTNAPLANSSEVHFNSQFLNSTLYSISGLNLTLNLTSIGYPIENTDVITANYIY